jgi:ferredoxin
VLHVWIDQDLCTGDGLCTDHCPELFVILEDGISYVLAEGRPQNDPGGSESMAPVADPHLAACVAAAEDCPGECIFLEEVGPAVTRPHHR